MKMNYLEAQKIVGNYPLNTCKLSLPRFSRWGGGGVPYTWTFGWLTGRDNDLVCVKSKIDTPIAGEVALSPVCSNRLLAFIAFAMKAILVRIDQNLRDLAGNNN